MPTSRFGIPTRTAFTSPIYLLRDSVAAAPIYSEDKLGLIRFAFRARLISPFRRSKSVTFLDFTANFTGRVDAFSVEIFLNRHALELFFFFFKPYYL